MIEKIDNEQIRQFVEKAAPQKPPVSRTGGNNEPDATLQVDCVSLIEQAKSPAAESNTVEKARELLKSGQLDTPENIRQAAENIAKFGI
jgi:hypothetical protein